MIEKQRVLIVLGMHRSGTSAMAGVLNHLGIPMGDNLMPPRKGENDKGFWENESIVELHEQLLKDLGMSWDDTRLMPEQWWLRQEVSEIKLKLKAVINREFGSFPLWAFKDPRTCRLMPLWYQVLNELNIKPLFIHVIRNPVDVDRSLYSREGLESKKTLLLWFIHNIEAFQATRNYPRVISVYDELIEDAVPAMQNVFHALSLDERVVNKEAIGDFFSPKLRHHNTSDDKLKTIPPLFSHLYELCLGQYNGISEGFDKAIDSLVADYLRMADTFSPWQRLPSAVSANIEEYQNTISTLKSILAESNDEVVAVQQQKKEIHEQLIAWKARSEEVEGQLVAWRLRADEREKQLDVIQIQKKELNDNLIAWMARAEETYSDQVEERLEVWQARAESNEKKLSASKQYSEKIEEQLSDLKRISVQGEETLTNPVKQRYVHKLVRPLTWLKLKRVVKCAEGRGVDVMSKVYFIIKEHGLKGLCWRVKNKIQNYKKSGPLVVSMQNNALLDEVNPHKIKYHIDLPESDVQSNVINILTVAGWACSESEISTIRIFIDDVFHTVLCATLARVDVGNAFPDINKSSTSGFSGDIDISGYSEGQHELSIIVEDKEGSVAVYRHNILKINDGFMYHNYFLSSLLKDEKVEFLKKNINDSTKKVSLKLFIFIKNDTNYIETVDSVANQSAGNWSCDIVIDKVRHAELTDIVSDVLVNNGKVRIVDTVNLKEFKDEGLYFCFIQSGEVLTKDALLQWEYFLSQNAVDVSYSDNDLVQDDGLHTEPNFKPDWSPDYFLSNNYIGNVFFIKNIKLFHDLFYDRIDTDLPAWRYELLLSASEKTNSIGHISKILWSESNLKTNTDALYDAEIFCVEKSFLRNGINAEIESLANKSIRVINRHVGDEPKVSIIIPTTGKIDLLVPCLNSILNKTNYKNYELIFIDNGRGKHPEGINYLVENGVKVLEKDEPFNWAKLNNDGVKESTGEIFLFLNDDVEVIDETWLTNLVSHAVREGVGSVGAMLLYPDGRIQHGGIFLVDHGGGARHYLHFLNPDQPIYQNLHQVVREVSASTGACLMISRAIFEEMNGFDEDLAIVGNDVDICLRIKKAGYRNIWTPECTLVHHESVSRKEIKITDDEEKMWSRWGDEFRKGDPYYNSNLTKTKTDCSLCEPPPASTEEDKSAESKTDQSHPGINLVAYIRAEMGVGEASRSMASAMDGASVPFCIINYEHGNPSRMTDNSWAHKIVSEPEYDINLFHINADLIPEVLHNLPNKFTKRRYNIGLWAWEMSEFPDRWIESFSYLDEIWVPSEFVRRAVMEKSPIPVITIPHSVRPMNQPYLKKAFFKFPDDRFIFLSMYDVHSIQERKNPKGAIDAYKQAFPVESSSTVLVIKVNNADETELSKIQGLTKSRSDIILINSALSRYEVDSLISCCDCFVSLHRSEGFGLVMAEAMALGKSVIATNWSGNEDFMNADNSACVDHSLVKLHRSYGPYDEGQLWAEPDIAHAASWMTRLVTEPKLCRRLGEKARIDVMEGLSMHTVGQKIIKRLETI